MWPRGFTILFGLVLLASGLLASNTTPITPSHASTRQGGGGDATAWTDALVNSFTQKSCNPLLALFDNDTDIMWMNAVLSLSNFDEACTKAQAAANVTAIACWPEFTMADAAVIACNTTAYFPRTNTTATFRALFHFAANPITGKLAYFDSQILDYKRFMDAYLTRADKNLLKLGRAIWMTGDVSTANISASCVISIPNLFARPVALDGPDEFQAALMAFSNSLDAFDVLDTDFVLSNDSTSSIRIEVVMLPAGADTAQPLQRTLWITALFDPSGNLTSLEIVSSEPIEFWDMSPLADLGANNYPENANINLESYYDEYEEQGPYGEGYYGDNYYENSPLRRSFPANRLANLTRARFGAQRAGNETNVTTGLRRSPLIPFAAWRNRTHHQQRGPQQGNQEPITAEPQTTHQQQPTTTQQQAQHATTSHPGPVTVFATAAGNPTATATTAAAGPSPTP